jgi:N-acetylmuramoyl-L-alanine amidase
MRVYIDPGHGGRNTGTKVGNLQEKTYTLAFATKLKSVLHNFYRDYDVALSREQDSYINNADRARFANEWGADLIISIHVNAHQRADIGGLMCFHIDAVGEEIGSKIMDCAPRGLKRTKSKSYLAQGDDWTKDAYACIEGYNAPVVLVELFFASDPSNLEQGTSRPGTNALLSAVVQGITLHETNLYFNGKLEDGIDTFR